MKVFESQLSVHVIIWLVKIRTQFKEICASHLERMLNSYDEILYCDVRRHLKISLLSMIPLNCQKDLYLKTCPLQSVNRSGKSSPSLCSPESGSHVLRRTISGSPESQNGQLAEIRITLKYFTFDWKWKANFESF